MKESKIKTELQRIRNIIEEKTKGTVIIISEEGTVNLATNGMDRYLVIGKLESIQIFLNEIREEPDDKE